MNRSQRGGRGRGKPAAAPPKPASAPVQKPVDPRVAREAEEARRRVEEAALKAARDAEEKAERERQRKVEEEAKLKAAEEVRRKAAAEAEAKRKVEEEARRREEEARRLAEEQRRLLAQQAAAEKQKLEEQRRQAEEIIRNKKEAIQRAEAERCARMEEMHRQIQRQREAQMNQLAAERADRERLEKLKQEVDALQIQKNVVKPVALSRPVNASRPGRVGDQQARSGADFMPQSALDHEVLNVYRSRTPPDEALPPVTFSKRAEGLYFLGSRKCQVEEHGATLLVKKGQQYQDLLTWIEQTERVEALRQKGLKSAQTYLLVQQAGRVKVN